MSTFSGTGTAGQAEAPAQFRRPAGVAVDGSGNVYLADTGNHRICKVTAAGVVTVLAGGASFGRVDGVGADAKFYEPEGLVVDSSGNVFVADKNNHCIRKITAAGLVTTLAGSGTLGSTDGTGAAASFNEPRAVCLQGGNIMVADTANNRIRQVSANGAVTTVVNGITDPRGIAAENGSTLVVSSQSGHQVSKVTTGGAVSAFLGNGTGSFLDGSLLTARVNAPNGLAVDTSGAIYLADSGNNRIRKIFGTGVTTLAGTGAPGRVDGSGGTATFNIPRAVAVDGSGNIYVADEDNHCIRKLTLPR